MLLSSRTTPPCNPCHYQQRRTYLHGLYAVRRPSPDRHIGLANRCSGLPGQLALRRRLRNDTCRRRPGSPAAPRHLARPFGDAALPAPPLTRQTTSASTPTSPPWAWRPARDPRRRSSAARDPSPLLFLHSAPSSHCARGPSGPPMLGFLHGPRPHSGPTPTAPGPAARAAVTPFKPGSRPHGHVTPCARPRLGRSQAAYL